jgi:hypothetical protein
LAKSNLRERADRCLVAQTEQKMLTFWTAAAATIVTREKLMIHLAGFALDKLSNFQLLLRLCQLFESPRLGIVDSSDMAIETDPKNISNNTNPTSYKRCTFETI